MMTNVFISPTPDTAFGIDDKYDIVNANTHMDIHMSIKQSDLKGIIEANDYNVVSGEKYL